MPDLATIVRAPKALPSRPSRRRPATGDGHRPGARVRLRRACRRPTSTTSRAWFRRGADRKSLELYLETFAPHVRRHAGARRDRPGRRRVRRGPRRRRRRVRRGPMAPELSHRARPDPRRGRWRRTSRGSGSGSARAAAAGPADRRCGCSSPRCARRPARSRSPSARSAGATRASSASTSPGPRRATAPTRHLDAFDHVRRENFHITIHAGESFGLPSIWEALQFCGAERLGHGVRIVDDITVRDDGSVELGRLAAFVRDRRVPLEMCPTLERPHRRRGLDRRAPDRPPAPAPISG